MGELRDNEDYYLHIEEDYDGFYTYNGIISDDTYVTGGVLKLDSQGEQGNIYLLGNEPTSLFGEGDGLRYHKDFKLKFRFSVEEPSAVAPDELIFSINFIRKGSLKYYLKFHIIGGASNDIIYFYDSNNVSHTIVSIDPGLVDGTIYDAEVEVMDGLLRFVLNGTEYALQETLFTRGIDEIEIVCGQNDGNDAISIYDTLISTPIEPNNKPVVDMTSALPANDASETNRKPTFSWGYNPNTDWWDDYLGRHPVPSFSGSDLDDMTIENEETTLSHTDFKIEIDAEGTPDTFKWSNDGGSTWYATGVSITGAAQHLISSLYIKFAATTGHTLAEYWYFTSENPPIGFGIQIATSEDFNEGSIILSVENKEDDSLSFVPTTNLPISDLFWKVRVLDRGEYIINKTSPYHDYSTSKWSDWSAARTLHIKFITPTCTPTNPTIDVGQELTFGLTGADADAEYYKWDFGDGTISDWQTSNEIIYAYSANGSYNAKVKYKDGEDNESDWSTTQTVTVDDVAPNAILTVSAKTIPATKNIMFSLANSYDENTNDSIHATGYKFQVQDDSGGSYSDTGSFANNGIYASDVEREVSFSTAANYRVRGMVKDTVPTNSSWTDWYYFTVVSATLVATSLDSMFEDLPSVITKSISGEFFIQHQVTKGTYTGPMVYPIENVNEKVPIEGKFLEDAGIENYITMRDYIRNRTYISLKVIDITGHATETISGYLASFEMKRQGGWTSDRDWRAEIIRFNYDDYVANCVTGDEILINAYDIELAKWDMEFDWGTPTEEYDWDAESLTDWGTPTEEYDWDMET